MVTLLAGMNGVGKTTGVTLLAGMNGVGKTTVLEACRVYAARGRYSVLSDLVSKHEEYFTAIDERAIECWRQIWRLFSTGEIYHKTLASR